MRKVVFSIALAALVVAGCGASARRPAPTPAPPPPPRSEPPRTDPPPPPSSVRRDPPPPSRVEAPDPVTVDCGQREPFDTDGDGISDPIERNNGENNYADLKTGRCDDDPSKPVGPPSNGDLVGGLNLPDRGTGYSHFYGTDGIDVDDWGVLKTLDCLERVGRAVEGIDVGVGDLSLRSGGAFPPHVSHQNGLDVDLRYVRKDRRQVPLDLRFQPDEYDLDATKQVFEAFFSQCDVDVIFVDIDRIGFVVDGREERVIHVNGHSNHYHVRLGVP